MRLIVEMSHPADINFFKNALQLLSDKGWEYRIVTRGRENTVDILDSYNLKYYQYGKTRPGIASRPIQLILNDYNLLWFSKKYEPDCFLSFCSPYCSHVASIMGKPSIAFTDTETATMTIRLTYPFCTALYTPTFFGNDYGKKHYRFNGFKELAYLSPKYFKPDELPLEYNNKEYAIVRINSFDAVHDIGLPQRLLLDDWKRIICAVSNFVEPIILSELELPKELRRYAVKIPPTKFHIILQNARFVISDSCTITTESALLGIPTIFCHPNPARLMNFSILEKRYGLIEYRNRVNEIISLINKYATDFLLRKELIKRRGRLLSEMDDVTLCIIRSIERVFE